MRFKQIFVSILAGATLLSGCTAYEDTARRTLPEPSQMRGPGRVQPGVILVKMQSEPEDPMELAEALPGLSISSVERLFTGPARFEARKRARGLHLWYRVTFDESTPVTRAATDIMSAGGIQEINYVHEVRFTDAPATWPFDDPKLPDQWHYMNFGTGIHQEEGSDINLFPAWNVTTGSPDVIVAVIDSGVDVDHEDLAWNMWVNEAELNGQPGVDDDGNGYVDDIHGFNFVVGNNNQPVGQITAEEHGTHVAGTIAAVNNNGLGVSGIAGGDYAAGKPGVRIMTCQTGPGSAFIAQAFVYAADNGAVISQNSWTCDPSYTVVLESIDYFNQCAGMENVEGDETGVQDGPMAGGLTIFAAGNSSSSTTDIFPANYENVLAVAAIGPDYRLASYSNYGEWVDISAPGGDAQDMQQIMSTIPNNGYEALQGTSMACPHVSGVAALVVSAFGGPGFTNDNLRTILTTGVRNIDEYNRSYVGKMGAGLVDAELCLTSYGPEPPDPVDEVASVSSTGSSVTLKWVVPEDVDSGKPDHFLVFSSTESLADLDPENPGPGVTVSEFETGRLSPGDEITVEVRGLKASTEYWFRVQAVDNMGSRSPLSEQISFSTTDNTPPVITTEDATDITLKFHENTTLSFSISDPDGDELSYEFEPGSDAASVIRNENVIRVMIDALKAPVSDEEVTYTSVLSVSDPAGAVTEQEIHYTVQPNHAPILASQIQDICMDLYDTQEINLLEIFSDADGENLRYEVASSSTQTLLNATVSGTTLKISPRAYGQDVLTVTAYDAAGTSASCQFAVVVRDASRTADFYPNPVTDYLNVRTGEAAASASVRVRGANGGTVLSLDDLSITPFAPARIDLTALPGGMYSVTLTYTAPDGTERSVTTDIAKL